jgi:hypothetical protein
VQHSDPDVLALLALGEPAPPADTTHVADCPECRDEVAALGRVVATVRSGDSLDADLSAGVAAAEAAESGPAITPPPQVWDAIASRTGVAVAPRPEVMVATAPPDTVTPLRRERSSGGRSRVGEPARRRWSRTRTLTLAVAASLLVGAAAGSLVTHAVSNPGAPASQQVLAQVDLDNLKPQNTSASGHASVVETKAGPRLKVDVAALKPQAGHFYEVWLIDKNIKKMVPVGILAPGDDEFVIPNGVDISQYPVVDISVQQPGDPKHSGDSVLRGTISG